MQTLILVAALLNAIGRPTLLFRRRFGVGCFAAAGVLLAGSTYLFLPMRPAVLDELGQPYSYFLYFAMFGGFSAGFTLIELGRRLRAPQAGRLVEHGKEFVLYLRPFSADQLRGQRQMGILMVVPPERYEEALVGTLRRVAPVIAVQRPGEAVPPLGAARLVLSDNWGPAVESLIRRAKLTVLVGGASDGLRWEVEAALRCADPRRLLVFLGLSDHWKSTEDRLTFIRSLPGRPSRYLIHADDSLFLLFNTTWDPVFVKPVSWQGWLNATDIIVNALERVLAQTPWLQARFVTRWGHLRAHAIAALYILGLIAIGMVYQLIVFHKASGQPWAHHLSWTDGVGALRKAEKTWRIRKALCAEEMKALEAGEFYTHGSSRQAVILIQGKPLRDTSDRLRYGAGDVNFSGDRVTSWQNVDVFSLGGRAAAALRERLLKARSLSCDTSMLPGFESMETSSIEADWLVAEGIENRLRSGFGIGSTQFNVQMAEGIPDHNTRSPHCAALRRCDSALVYRDAEVFIGNDRVIGWVDDGRQFKIR